MEKMHRKESLIPLEQYDKAQLKAAELVHQRLGNDCPEELAGILERAKTSNQARVLFNDWETGRVNQNNLPPKPEIDTNSHL